MGKAGILKGMSCIHLKRLALFEGCCLEPLLKKEIWQRFHPRSVVWQRMLLMP
jgi:hypothetical protein